MAKDAVHSEGIIDAVIATLKSKLPAGWDDVATGEAPLKRCEHGDLSDWPANQPLSGVLPAIYVRCLGVTPGSGGVGGVGEFVHSMRLVHVRDFDDCYTELGAREGNPTRARERYAKTISAALFDISSGLLGNPSLSTVCTSARVCDLGEPTWDLGGGSTEEVRFASDLQAKMICVACDFDVTVQVIP